jgi:hypothetical protein
MGLIALIIGITLIVAAVRNSQGALFTALEVDVPKFVVWAAAIIAVGAIGAIPGLKPISRWLLALVIVVIIVNNYKKLTTGFQNAWQKSPAGDTPPVKAGNASAAPASPDFLSGLMNSNPFGNFLAPPGG